MYNEEKDTNIVRDNGGVSDEVMFPLFKAGQSKRIWRELHKVTINLVNKKKDLNFYFNLRLLIHLML